MTHDSTHDSDRSEDGTTIDRRMLLGSLGGALATGLAGCNQQESAEYDASPVRLDAGVGEQGYSLLEASRSALNRTVELPGVTLEVTLRNHFASYQHGSELAVGLASTPAAEQAGQALNPLAVAPLGELLTSDIGESFVSQVGIDAGWSRGPEQVGDHETTLLGDSVDAKIFAGVTDDDEFVLLNLARTETGDGEDVVLIGTAWSEPAVGDHPLVGEDGYVPRKIVDRSADEFAYLLSAVIHGEDPGEPGTPGYPSEVPQILDDPEADALWKDLSRQLIESRADQEPTRPNEALAEAAASVDSEGLAGTFRFWIAENLRLAERHEDAIARYTAVFDAHGEATFRRIDVGTSVLQKRAHSEVALGRIDDALSTYDALIDHKDENLARPFYLKGLAAEKAGREDVARTAYGNAADAEGGFPNPPWSFQELGGRAVARLENSFDEYYDEPDELVARLAAAVREGAYEELRSLASPTHFTAGPFGGCCDFVHTDAVMEDLIADAAGSELRVPEEDLERSGGSVYLPTRGWAGEFFGGEVIFEVSKSPQGWSFTGLGLSVSAEVLEAQREDDLDLEGVFGNFLDKLGRDWQPSPGAGRYTPVPSTDTPTPTPKRSPKRTRGKVATMDISAPWSKGERFSAGGQIDWGVPNPTPAKGACKRGPGGFYYKTGPTHSGKGKKHAIDFTRYEPPFNNRAYDTPVKATNYGEVRHAYYGTNDGNSGTANNVVLNHMNGQLPGSGVYTDYRSIYLHLRNVNFVSVSKGAFLDQGERLGYMDDTGTSLFHHLHFNVRKIYNGESVQPTPMDGQSLKQTTSDNGSCIHSR